MFASFTALFVDANALVNHTWDVSSGGFPSFEISSKKLFWLAFFHQVVAVHSMVVFSMNFDMLVVGYMLQICAQIEILEYNVLRISVIKGDCQYRAIVNCIKLHNKMHI